MFGLLHRRICFLTYFFAITCALMAVYVTSPEAVWALRPRGSPPLCPPELRARLVSFGLWTPTRLIYTTTGWRPVPRRGCRAGRRVCKQRLTSLSVSTLRSCREWQIPVIVGRRLSAERQRCRAEFATCSTTTRRRRRQSPSRRSALRAVRLCRHAAHAPSSSTLHCRVASTNPRRLCMY